MKSRGQINRMEDAKVNLAKLLWKPLNQLGGHDNTVTNSLSNAAVSNTEGGERKVSPGDGLLLVEQQSHQVSHHFPDHRASQEEHRGGRVLRGYRLLEFLLPVWFGQERLPVPWNSPSLRWLEGIYQLPSGNEGLQREFLREVEEVVLLHDQG